MSEIKNYNLNNSAVYTSLWQQTIDFRRDANGILSRQSAALNAKLLCGAILCAKMFTMPVTWRFQPMRIHNFWRWDNNLKLDRGPRKTLQFVSELRNRSTDYWRTGYSASERSNEMTHRVFLATDQHLSLAVKSRQLTSCTHKFCALIITRQHAIADAILLWHFCLSVCLSSAGICV